MNGFDPDAREETEEHHCTVLAGGVLVLTTAGMSAEELGTSFEAWKRQHDYDHRIYGSDITGKWLIANPSRRSAQ